LGDQEGEDVEVGAVNDNTERNAEIVRRRLTGEWPTDIAKSMGLSRNTVIGVCWRHELSVHGAQYIAAREKHAKMTLEQAIEAKRLYWSGMTAAEAASAIGPHVSPSMVTKAALSYTWKDV
jgi:hypothetical protein